MNSILYLLAEKEINDTYLYGTLETVSIQNVQMVATTTELISEIALKGAKLDTKEKEAIKKAGDAMQNALNFLANIQISNRIGRQITEEMEKMEELEADSIFALKNDMNTMEDEMNEANENLSTEKERLVCYDNNQN